MGFPSMELSAEQWNTDRNCLQNYNQLWLSVKMQPLETLLKLFDLLCGLHGGRLCTFLLVLSALVIISPEWLSSTMPTSLLSLHIILTLKPFTTELRPISVHCKRLNIDGHSVDRSKSFEVVSKDWIFPDHPSHLQFWKHFMSVICDYVVDSMEGNLILRTS